MTFEVGDRVRLKNDRNKLLGVVTAVGLLPWDSNGQEVFVQWRHALPGQVLSCESRTLTKVDLIEAIGTLA